MITVTGVKIKNKSQGMEFSFYPLEFGKADKEKLLHLAVSCLIIKDNKILIVKRSKDNYIFSNHFTLPSGHVDYGKTPLKQVKQEVKEEVGIKVTKVKRIFEDQLFIDRYGHLVYPFISVLKGEPKLSISEKELDPEGSEFIPINELGEKLNSQKFTDTSRMILLRFLREHSNLIH